MHAVLPIVGLIILSGCGPSPAQQREKTIREALETCRQTGDAEALIQSLRIARNEVPHPKGDPDLGEGCRLSRKMIALALEEATPSERKALQDKIADGSFAN